MVSLGYKEHIQSDKLSRNSLLLALTIQYIRTGKVYQPIREQSVYN